MIRALAAKASGGGRLLRYAGGEQSWGGGGGGGSGGAPWPAAFIAGATAADDSGLVGAYLVDGDDSSAASSINSNPSQSGEWAGASGSHRRVNSSHYLMGSL